jgi:hypothetical protein
MVLFLYLKTALEKGLYKFHERLETGGKNNTFHLAEKQVKKHRKDMNNGR